jgi:hypothetical protein
MMASPHRLDGFEGSGYQNKASYMNASSHSYNPNSYDPVSKFIFHLISYLKARYQHQAYS